jgi:TM2 domain-containing membrane protein YozV
MRYLLALLFPWITFFTMGKIGQGLLCLLLQLTIIGWLPAAIWALVSVGSYNADKRTDRIVNAMTQTAQPQIADPRRI